MVSCRAHCHPSVRPSQRRTGTSHRQSSGRSPRTFLADRSIGTCHDSCRTPGCCRTHRCRCRQPQSPYRAGTACPCADLYRRTGCPRTTHAFRVPSSRCNEARIYARGRCMSWWSRLKCHLARNKWCLARCIPTDIKVWKRPPILQNVGGYLPYCCQKERL